MCVCEETHGSILKTCCITTCQCLSWCSKLKDTHILHWPVSTAYQMPTQKFYNEKKFISLQFWRFEGTVSASAQFWRTSQWMESQWWGQVQKRPQGRTASKRSRDTCTHCKQPIFSWELIYFRRSSLIPARATSPCPTTLYCIHFSKVSPPNASHCGEAKMWNLWVETLITPELEHMCIKREMLELSEIPSVEFCYQ